MTSVSSASRTGSRMLYGGGRRARTEKRVAVTSGRQRRADVNIEEEKHRSNTGIYEWKEKHWGE